MKIKKNNKNLLLKILIHLKICQSSTLKKIKKKIYISQVNRLWEKNMKKCNQTNMIFGFLSRLKGF